MNNLHPFIWYLLKVAIALSVVFLFYQLFLRRLTFYKLNRSFLLTYSLFSFILPLLDISSLFSAGKIETIPVIGHVPSMNRLWVSTSQYHIIEQLPINSASPVSWQSITGFIFVSGLLIMIARFFVQLAVLYAITRKATPLVPPVPGTFTVQKQIAPFSFVNRIYMHQPSHTLEELDEIIAHEKTHIKQKHYLDIFFMQLVCMLQWFNPFAWLLSRAIRENLEFLADEAVLNKGIDRKHYQYHLLKVTGANASLLANSFNFSSITTRIRMMNKSQTSKIQIIRLLILLPLTLMVLMLFRSVAKTIETSNKINPIVVFNPTPEIQLHTDPITIGTPAQTMIEKNSNVSTISNEEGIAGLDSNYSKQTGAIYSMDPITKLATFTVGDQSLSEALAALTLKNPFSQTVYVKSYLLRGVTQNQIIPIIVHRDTILPKKSDPPAFYSGKIKLDTFLVVAATGDTSVAIQTTTQDVMIGFELLPKAKSLYNSNLKILHLIPEINKKDTIITPVPAGTIYEWSVPNNNRFTGSLKLPQTATYTVTQIAEPGGANMKTFTVTVTINPYQPEKIPPVEIPAVDIPGPGATKNDISIYRSIIKKECYRNTNGEADFIEFSEAQKEKLAYVYAQMNEQQRNDAFVKALKVKDRFRITMKKVDYNKLKKMY